MSYELSLFLAALTLKSNVMQLFGFVILDCLTSVRGTLFSHFDGSFLSVKKLPCVVLDKVNKTFLGGMFFCRFRTKNSHTINHAPTELCLCNMPNHCHVLSDNVNMFSSSIRKAH